MSKVVSRTKDRGKRLLMSLMAVLAVMPGSAPLVFASGGGQPSLEIDFNVADMFVWAQTIVNAMLPVVYITMGLGLGFLIIRSLRAAFN